MKGYYQYKLNEIPPYIHNLRRLAIESKLFDNLNDEFKDLINKLNPLNIEARYPSYREMINKSLNKKNCKDILKKTEVFKKWIENQLK